MNGDLLRSRAGGFLDRDDSLRDLQAGFQFIRVERFGHEVVGAGFHSFQVVALPNQRGEHEVFSTHTLDKNGNTIEERTASVSTLSETTRLQLASGLGSVTQTAREAARQCALGNPAACH